MHQLYLIGLNHRTADLAIRERFALAGRECGACSPLAPQGAIVESLWLSTCNRVEVLVCGPGEETWRQAQEAWAGICGAHACELESHLYSYCGEDAVRHVLRVASSLDSLVLGEPQILGQLKDAYRRAVDDNTVKLILGRLLHKAFMTAKRVRSETALASAAVSISYAAVALARRIFDSLSGKQVLLIGAGEMAELAAAHLCEGQGALLAVTNRTFERAFALAERFKAKPLEFEQLQEHLEQADIVISSTGAPEPIISREMMRAVMKKRKNKPVFIIDIAVPRDVEESVGKLDNVYLYAIDDLSAVVEENRAARRDEAVKAEAIVEEECIRFCQWLRSLSLQPAIADLVCRAERIAEEELARTLRRIGPVSDEMRSALEAMLGGVIKKLNHAPISYLKRRFNEGEEAGLAAVGTLRRVFNLDGEELSSTPHPGRKRS